MSNELEKKFELLEEKVHCIMEKHPDELNLQEVRLAIKDLLNEYVDQYGFNIDGLKGFLSSWLTEFGEMLMENGELGRGLKFIQYGGNLLPKMYANEIVLYLRSAQYYIEKGDIETGTKFLKKLCCETSSNYEESIGFSGLTHIWEKYRYLIDGQVPASISTNDGDAPCLPEECTKSIEDIMKLSEEDLLIELSEHLDEMSGLGDSMNWLNKWERIVYDANELCTRINADGVEDFLFARGHRMKQTKQALEAIGAEKSVHLLELIASKFPKGKVPKSPESIENKVMSMIEKDETIFDEAEDYFEEADLTGELLDKIYQFVMDNKKKFR